MRFPKEHWEKKKTTGCNVPSHRVSNGICQQGRSHPLLAIRYTFPPWESIYPIRHIWMNMELIRKLRTILCVEIAAPKLQSKHLQPMRK